MKNIFIKNDGIMSCGFILLLILFSSIFNHLAAGPTIAGISPNHGSSLGNTIVTITGTDFTGTTSVSFGDALATSFIVNSDTQITATTPAYVPQVVSLTITNGTTASTNYVYTGNYQVYVANGNEGTLSVIDSTNVVVNTLTVGNNPSYVTFTPDGYYAIVANQADNTLSIINLVTSAISTVSSEGVFPNSIVVNPNYPTTSVAYVANNNGIVSALDIPTGSSVWTYQTGGNPLNLAITPDGTYLGITDTATDKVTFLDATTGLSHNQISVGVSPDCIILNPITTTAYVTNNNSRYISVIDPYTGSSSTSVIVGNNATALALTPDGNNLYVLNATDNVVSHIDTHTNTGSNFFVNGVFPKNIMMTPDGTKGYVTNSTSGTVSVITTSNDNVDSITVGSNPYAIGILPNGSNVYIGNSGSNSVSIISGGSVVATPTVGVFPCSIAITPDQAPLALFSYQINAPGIPVSFDASASISPIGTITNYAWDFGDGETLETSSATTSHLYTLSNTYPVTLTVTNSAGTSTTQIFNHSSSHNFNLNGQVISQSEFISHNGGPTATTTHTLTITAPPSPLNTKYSFPRISGF